MTYETILLDQPEPGIWLLTINRPKALNALSPQVLYEVATAVAHVNADANARVLLVTGAGDKAFVAGADIAAMSSMTAIEGREFARKGHATLRSLELSPFPVIALVNGFALGGGCELALACDWIVASEQAVFGQPEVNLGICSGIRRHAAPHAARGQGRWRWRSSAPAGRSRRTRRSGSASSITLFRTTGCTTKGSKLARMVAAKGPVAVKMSKHLVQRGQDLDLANANAMEADVFGFLCATEDRHEGMAAFLGKRAPHGSRADDGRARRHVHGAGETRQQRSVAARHVDAIDGDPSRARDLDRRGGERLAALRGDVVGDVRIDAHGDHPVRVRREAERGIGEREDHAAMARTVEVEVPVADRERHDRPSRPGIGAADAQCACASGSRDPSSFARSAACVLWSIVAVSSWLARR